jgi:hypothetical protein
MGINEKFASFARFSGWLQYKKECWVVKNESATTEVEKET